MKRILVVEDSDNLLNLPVFMEYDIVLREVGYGFRVERCGDARFSAGEHIVMKTTERRT